MSGLVEFDVLQNKIILVNEDTQIKVSEQPFFLENVKINNVDIPYRFLTPTADHQNQIIIKDFIDKFIDENLFQNHFSIESLKYKLPSTQVI
ncbi:hypothetical protein [Chryseobacterium indoltheticum]|uniref:hypothetical protein n=1 Tax=Chryseobacterium indoltheticum TaxID=254 RepID=UPI003F491E99